MTDGPPVAPELIDFAEALVDVAGLITMRWFRSADLQVEHKSDGSVVTAADREAEQAMRDLIARERPGDGIVGEEFEEVPTETGLRWILDPIDGTISFAHGVPLFSTLVALTDHTGPAVGVIDAPAVGERAVGGRGRGCVVNGDVAHVSTAETLTGATIVTSGLADYWPEPMLHRILSSPALVRTWADGGYGYILLASGRIDAMLDAVVNPWDVAPAECLIPEAGGRAEFLDVAGRQGFVATNGPIHNRVVSLL